MLPVNSSGAEGRIAAFADAAQKFILHAPAHQALPNKGAGDCTALRVRMDQKAAGFPDSTIGGTRTFSVLAWGLSPQDAPSGSFRRPATKA